MDEESTVERLRVAQPDGGLREQLSRKVDSAEPRQKDPAASHWWDDHPYIQWRRRTMPDLPFAVLDPTALQDLTDEQQQQALHAALAEQVGHGAHPAAVMLTRDQGGEDPDLIIVEAHVAE